MPTIEPDHPLVARDPRLRPYRAFIRAHLHVWRRLDEDLRIEHGLSLQEYVALVNLAEAPDRRLRMSRLADVLSLSRSGVTRLVDRLVHDGFVRRISCESDARGAEAILTPSGVERIRAAAPTHLRGIAEYFIGPASDDELAAIERSMTRVADHVVTLGPRSVSGEGAPRRVGRRAVARGSGTAHGAASTSPLGDGHA